MTARCHLGKIYCGTKLGVLLCTVTMAPEKGKCKFKDEWLTMPAYKEWACRDPNGDIIAVR